MSTPDQWLKKLTKLRIDRASGDPAPHKPLLLLAILDLADCGELPKETLPLSPELAFKFYTYWSIVAHRRKQRPDVRLPSHYLRTDGFWSVLDNEGRPSAHYRNSHCAVMPSDFVGFANDPAARDRARRILIATYFDAQEQVGLYTLFGMPVPPADEIARDRKFRSFDEAEQCGREVRFRLNIVARYNYTCALTGYRLTTITAGSIVDAAHIHQFADSRNNDPKNGIALCKNAHWQFDQGLWTISDDYRVIVAAGKFAEACPDGRGLTEYHGNLLRLPSDRSLWPDARHLLWHRQKRLQSA
jgi:putative restriction endonuclease